MGGRVGRARNPASVVRPNKTDVKNDTHNKNNGDNWKKKKTQSKVHISWFVATEQLAALPEGEKTARRLLGVLETRSVEITI